MSIKKFLINKAPVLASVAAVGGVISVAYFSARDTLKAKEIYDEEKRTRINNKAVMPKTKVDTAKIVWKAYIPTAISVGVTVSSIVALNYIGERRTAAAASAAALTEAAFHNYREKVAKRLSGEDEEKIYKESGAEEILERRNGSVVISGDDVLILDEWSGRYFKSSVEDIRASVNRLNHDLLTSMYASLSEFYELIGLETTHESEEVGWTNDCLLAVSFHPIMAPNNKPALAMSFDSIPNAGYSVLQ
ncbi:MAG: hypothetical protein DI610_04910 [Staphylococcus hominis]|nr:MAG: hypothetical protein DI610_04910 [Staphylococcus hominis]